MTVEAASRYILDEVPEITAELHQALLDLIPQDELIIHIAKGKRMAILWLCGATYGQLSQMFGVAKPTAQAMAQRYIPREVREEVTPLRSKFTTNITETIVSAHKQIIDEMASNTTYTKLIAQGSASAIASAVLQEYNSRQAEFSEDAPSPYDSAIELVPSSRLPPKVDKDDK